MSSARRRKVAVFDRRITANVDSEMKARIVALANRRGRGLADTVRVALDAGLSELEDLLSTWRKGE